MTSKVISFDYYGQNREMSRRTVEPVQLLFKKYTWYLIAYCRERKASRIFKLTRIKRMEVLEESFEPRIEWYQKEDTNEKKQQDTKYAKKL